MIAALAGISLILVIMIFTTRSLIAALVIVGTVALSLGASIGLSILVWQYLAGIQLYWVIVPLAAGLVFAATMSSFIVSDLVMLGQLGTTIGLGLLFDTPVVRSFMTPSIATLLGRMPGEVRETLHHLLNVTVTN